MRTRQWTTDIAVHLGAAKLRSTGMVARVAMAIVGLLYLAQFFDPGMVESAIGLLTFAGWAAALTLPSGGFGTERSSDVHHLFDQQPTSLVKVYGERYLAAQLLNLGVQWVIAVLIVLAAVVNGQEFDEVIRILFAYPALGLIAGSMTFAFSAMGVARDAFMALVFIIMSFVLVLLLGLRSFQTEGFGDGLGGWEYLVFPIDSFGPVVESGSLLHTSVLVGHLVFWTALGLAALALRDRSPHPRSTPGTSASA